MHHIVYVSTATLPITEADLSGFLERWCENNARDGVTGLLLYAASGERFIQVIEGEEAPLRTLFGKIQQDYRHRDLVKLADGAIPGRHFTAWLMGFKVLTTEAFAQLAGYVEPASPHFQAALATTHDPLVRHLLDNFLTDRPE
jgi:hypothetical protein